jgi:alpha-beta hydrolase superfamily lysophospholipase
MDQALAAAPRLDVPALLLYGEKDEIVPLEPTLQLWRSLPAAAADEQRIALYADGWHMLLRDLNADVVIADIAAWIADPAASLPSGADDRALALLAEQEGTS